MNVIFLDIDGVLTTARTCIAYESSVHTLDPVAVRMIASLCKNSNMRICITSSWRIENRLRADFVLALGYHGGMPLIPYLIQGDDWCTPVLGDERDRSAEITAWLESHPETHIKLIIDDEVLNNSFDTCLVKTLPYEGFSFQNYLEAVKIIDTKSLHYGKAEVELAT